MGKYFTVEVKPVTTVAALAAGDINQNLIFADWTAFDLPKGPARLVATTIRLTGKNGADYNAGDFDIYYAKTINRQAPPTLGNAAGSVSSYGWFQNIISHTFVDESEMSDGTHLNMGNIFSVGGDAPSSGSDGGFGSVPAMVFQGEPDTGTLTGFDKFYAAIINGTTALNFGPSTMAVSTETATTTPVIIVKTLSALQSGIGPGDILRDEDNQLLGTVKSVDSATQITLEDDCASVSAVDKLVYNTTPITLVLSFEM